MTIYIWVCLECGHVSRYGVKSRFLWRSLRDHAVRFYNCVADFLIISEYGVDDIVKIEAYDKELVNNIVNTKIGGKNMKCCYDCGKTDVTLVERPKNIKSGYKNTVDVCLDCRDKWIKKYKNKGEKTTMVTIADMYSLDWKQILYKAVQSRPSSWRVEDPVTEYRNASDCIAPSRFKVGLPVLLSGRSVPGC
mgnify:CR=1 FL=1